VTRNFGRRDLFVRRFRPRATGPALASFRQLRQSVFSDALRPSKRSGGFFLGWPRGQTNLTFPFSCGPAITSRQSSFPLRLGPEHRFFFCGYGTVGSGRSSFGIRQSGETDPRGEITFAEKRSLDQPATHKGPQWPRDGRWPAAIHFPFILGRCPGVGPSLMLREFVSCGTRIRAVRIAHMISIALELLKLRSPP